MKIRFSPIFFAVAAVASAAPIEISVFPSIAPNSGSSTWNAYVANAIYALENKLTAYGDPASPAHYQQQYQAGGNEVLVTSFPSWEGQANPDGVYADEHGNRAHFGLVIDGNGTRFSISELAFSLTGDDVDGALNTTFERGTYDYSDSYVGVIIDGANRTYITSGFNTQLVDMVIGRGSGNALWPCGPGDTTPCSTPEEQQAALDYWAGYNTTTWHLNGVYTLTNDAGGLLAQGGATLTLGPVPEPTSLILIGLGLVVLALLGKRRFSLAAVPAQTKPRQS